MNKQNIFAWDNKYSVNIKELDLQHKALFDSMDELHRAITEKETPDRVYELHSELKSIVETHFHTEEEYLKIYEYDGLEEHLKEHDIIIQNIFDFTNKLCSGELSLSEKTLVYAMEWLSSHILEFDINYSSFLNKNGIF